MCVNYRRETIDNMDPDTCNFCSSYTWCRRRVTSSRFTGRRCQFWFKCRATYHGKLMKKLLKNVNSEISFPLNPIVHDGYVLKTWIVSRAVVISLDWVIIQGRKGWEDGSTHAILSNREENVIMKWIRYTNLFSNLRSSVSLIRISDKISFWSMQNPHVERLQKY